MRMIGASLVAQRHRICLQCGRLGFDPWVRKIPWRREWIPTRVFLPGEFHGQRSLAGYSPWGRKESDMTERLTLFMRVLKEMEARNIREIKCELLGV